MGSKRSKRGTYAKTGAGLTHEEIAAAMGISKQRVQQIEAAAFKKIRDQFPQLRDMVTN